MMRLSRAITPCTFSSSCLATELSTRPTMRITSTLPSRISTTSMEKHLPTRQGAPSRRKFYLAVVKDGKIERRGRIVVNVFLRGLLPGNDAAAKPADHRSPVQRPSNLVYSVDER